LAGTVSNRKKAMLSTEFVLLEIADGLAAVQFHKHAVQIINLLKARLSHLQLQLVRNVISE